MAPPGILFKTLDSLKKHIFKMLLKSDLLGPSCFNVKKGETTLLR